MKISASSYSFDQCFNDGRLNQLTCLDKAKEMGFDGIDLVGVYPHDESSVEDYAKRLREKSEALELPISNFAFGADFLTGSGGDLNAEIERVQRQIDVAALLGARTVRHDASNGWPREIRRLKGFEEAVPRIAEACRAVAGYAQQFGIVTMVENHGHFCQGGERLEMLARAVSHENFGLLVDMGNFVCADDDPVLAVSRCAPYAAHVHVKDWHIKPGTGTDPGDGFYRSRGGNYLRGAIVGHGDVPIKTCLKALRIAGYDGFTAIEFEGLEDSLVGLRIGLANLRRYIEESA